MRTASRGAVVHADSTGVSRASVERGELEAGRRAGLGALAERVDQHAAEGRVVVGVAVEALGRPRAARVALRARAVEVVDRRAEHRRAVLGEDLRQRVREHRLAGAVDRRPPRRSPARHGMCWRTSSRSSRRSVRRGSDGEAHGFQPRVAGRRHPDRRGRARRSSDSEGELHCARLLRIAGSPRHFDRRCRSRLAAMQTLRDRAHDEVLDFVPAIHDLEVARRGSRDSRGASVARRARCPSRAERPRGGRRRSAATSRRRSGSRPGAR